MKSGDEMSPNVRKLFIHRMSYEAIPAGGGLADGIRFFTDDDRRRAIMKNSEDWVIRALDAVRAAGEPNPWKNADDDAIAAEILRKIEK